MLSRFGLRQTHCRHKLDTSRVSRCLPLAYDLGYYFADLSSKLAVRQLRTLAKSQISQFVENVGDRLLAEIREVQQVFAALLE